MQNQEFSVKTVDVEFWGVQLDWTQVWNLLLHFMEWGQWQNLPTVYSCIYVPCGSSVCNTFLQEAPSNLPDLPREPLEKDECEEWLGRAQETDKIACCFVDRWNWYIFSIFFHVSHSACGSVLASSCDFSIWFPGEKAWDHNLFSLEKCEASLTYSAAIRGGSGTSPRTRGTEFLAEAKNQFMRTLKTIQIRVIMCFGILVTQ